ncbi:hypothetical protein LCGC14_0639930 [marine sediment metagenome]|uniref:Uncharacterized protein n=1 Tax=marine sediment metagenome TaxID=412755 RepID=A0A0F9U7V5_9ZZZZ
MANLIKGKKTNANKKIFSYRYSAGRKRGSGEFNSVSNKAALRYCGFNEKGEALKGGGLILSRLPNGARITHLVPTGRAAKK